MAFKKSTAIRILQMSLFFLLVISVYVRFYKNHHELPKGCDEFGYLHMSEAISNGNLLNSHTKRPFFNELKQHLLNQGYTTKEMTWVMLPHAYHLDEHSNKVINQYPIGTSLLMSFIPKLYRQYLFPVVVVLLIYTLTFLVGLKEDRRTREKQFTLITIFILLSILIAPFLTEYTSVNSVAPTFGFLLAAGVCYSRNWRVAALLIAITVNFRLANVLLISPILIHQLLQYGETKNFNYLARSVSQTLIILLVIGILPYSLYTKLLVDSFLASTYSSIDQASANLEMAILNFKYYFINENKWLIVSFLSLMVLYFLNFNDKKKTYLSFSFSLLFIYLFFLFHAAKTPYYPYGLSLIMIGVIIQKVSTLNPKKKILFPALNFIALVGLLAIFITNYSKYKSIKEIPTSLEIQDLKACFETYDVVWGELKTGTIEYATSTPTMRFYWGNQKIREEIMIWLKNNNYKQAIFLNDLVLNKEEIERLNNELHFIPNHDKINKCGVLLEL